MLSKVTRVLWRFDVTIFHDNLFSHEMCLPWGKAVRDLSSSVAIEMLRHCKEGYGAGILWDIIRYNITSIVTYDIRNVNI